MDDRDGAIERVEVVSIVEVVCVVQPIGLPLDGVLELEGVDALWDSEEVSLAGGIGHIE